MPRSQTVAVQNNFTKGLITEATGLNFPENASTDSDNVVFNRIGAAERRLGFDYEASHSTYDLTTVGNAIVSYQWLNVAGSGNIAFAVMQIGNNLHFYNVSGSASLSASKHATVIDLTAFCPAGITSVSTEECQFSAGNGQLFVTNPNLNSFFITYDPAANSLTTTAITINARDFDGDRTDPLAIDARPAVAIGGMTAAHRYNLQNQGWDSTTLASWDTARSDMPSNADVSWTFKSATNAFDFSTVANYFTGNSPAPQGHYVYSIYNLNRSSNFSGATDFAIATDRVSTSAFFAGRVFYSGLKYAGQGGKIFFSQVIEGNINTAQYGNCYQVNDPTSETLFNLLATDGGVINIIDAGTIVKMVSALNALFVFATNGVWAISGSTGSGFTANDYSVNKISAVRCPSATSFVSVEGLPFWWNLNGIWTIKTDPQTNNPTVTSITDSTIKTLFIDIPVESKSFARGTYNSLTKEIFWLYKNENSISFEDRYVYDTLLVFSLITGGFYKWSVDTSVVQINSLIEVNGIADSFSQFTVADSAVTVQDSSVDVVVFLSSTESLNSVVKYFVTFPHSSAIGSTFAECINDAYVDWETYDGVGVDYNSYFITGYKIEGQAIKKFQSNYINIYSDNSVDSSYKVRSLWNFATAGNSGKWSTSQVITNTADDFSNKNNRIKTRGSGLVCQYKVENNGNSPFNIIGWAVFETGNKWV